MLSKLEEIMRNPVLVTIKNGYSRMLAHATIICICRPMSINNVFNRNFKTMVALLVVV
ncbi:uncharacterized protein LOC143250988 isoform X3 [Tachypleus tridentatus]|uniref:uncharacterized protein LOC143250988 isoform X3 n=1 Tax=Tachypleus tridentatus TaxID=6853 RepID=UPI003FCFF1A6